jgi:hypothetical protein
MEVGDAAPAKPPKNAGAPSEVRETAPVKAPKNAEALSKVRGVAPAKEPIPHQQPAANIPARAEQPETGPAEASKGGKGNLKKAAAPKLTGDALLTSFFTGGVNNTTPPRTLAKILASSNNVLATREDFLDCMFPLPDAAEPRLTSSMIAKFKESQEMKGAFLRGYTRMLGFLGFAEMPPGNVTLTLGFDPEEHPWANVFDPNHDRITRMIRSMRLLGFESQAQKFYKGLITAAKGFPVQPPGLESWRRVTFRSVTLAPEALTPPGFEYPDEAPTEPLPKPLPVGPLGFDPGKVERRDGGGGEMAAAVPSPEAHDVFSVYRVPKGEDSGESDEGGHPKKPHTGTSKLKPKKKRAGWWFDPVKPVKRVRFTDDEQYRSPFIPDEPSSSEEEESFARRPTKAPTRTRTGMPTQLFAENIFAGYAREIAARLNHPEADPKKGEPNLLDFEEFQRNQAAESTTASR